MAMPLDLILVRHGQSEGNVATDLSKAGDNRHYTKEFLNRHSSLWRLTDKGKLQAQTAGEWLKSNVNPHFGRYYTSEYLRAVETAMLLGLPNAQWFLEFYLRERDWGDMDVMTHEEREKRFAESIAAKKRDAFYWTPPNGVAIADLCLRVDRVLETLHRECSDKSVVIVSHGEVMWGFRIRLERLTQQRFIELNRSRKPFEKINNCQILHYTRIDPESGVLMPYLGWMRSVCPWDLSRSSNEWQPIVRNRYSNKDLAKILERYPRVVNA
jgi:NAD+ kinase